MVRALQLESRPGPDGEEASEQESGEQQKLSGGAGAWARRSQRGALPRNDAGLRVNILTSQGGPWSRLRWGTHRAKI